MSFRNVVRRILKLQNCENVRRVGVLYRLQHEYFIYFYILYYIYLFIFLYLFIYEYARVYLSAIMVTLIR